MGDSAAIIGPSGSGKSTLLNILGGLDGFDGGTVTVNGLNLADLTEEQRARFRNREVGFVFQAHHLLPQCTVLENVLVPALVNGDMTREQKMDRAAELITSVGLGGKGMRYPAELSGGERHRVAVARSMMNNPPVILADEPTGSLDGDTAMLITDLLLNVCNRQGSSLIVVTHSQDVSCRMSRVYRIDHGKLEPWNC
jgi:ABC-type lipoprotein export system ATPase subunit